MVYITELSKAEANCILTAYHRLKRYLDYDTELCSHLSEKDFLCRDYAYILNNPKEMDFFGAVKLIHESVTDIADNRIFLKRILSKFKNDVKTLRFAQTLLWCSSLLTNFHKKEECSEYMSLALKFKLFAYWEVDYGDTESASRVTETMLEFLHYTSFYKCKQKVFTSCLGIFLRFYSLDGHEDHLVRVLPAVFRAAYRLGFNMFTTWDSEFRLNFVKYSQLSLLKNVRRFFTLARFGYEDIRFERDADSNLLCLYAYDRYNLFGCRSRWDEIMEVRNKMYRSLQVLVLYIQTTYEDVNPSQEVFDKVLLALWETIPDPYLTPKHFMFFKHFDEFPEYLKAWKWYSKVVLGDRVAESSPRSLKHLAKCSIRRKMTACAQFPFGVKDLDIPQTLISYLRLVN